MIDYNKIRQINKKSTRIRTNAGQTSDNSSFIYVSNNKLVKKGVYYHIHYTTDLEEYYMTGKHHTIFSRIIRPIKSELMTDFSIYSKEKKREYVFLYEKPYRSNPSPEDYRNGYFMRYFAKRVNDPSVPVFEVNETFNTPLYNIFQIKWTLGGGSLTTIRKWNKIASAQLTFQIPSVKKILTNYSEFYIMPQLTEELDIQKKLGVLRVRRDENGNKVFTPKQLSKGAKKSSTSTGPPPGIMTGGAGGIY